MPWLRTPLRLRLPCSLALELSLLLLAALPLDAVVNLVFVVVWAKLCACVSAWVLGSGAVGGKPRAAMQRVCCFRHLALLGSPSSSSCSSRNPMIEVQVTLGSLKALEEAVERELARTN